MTYGGLGEDLERRPDLVSVLLPCCDQPYAVRTWVIPSVLRQSHADWELIVLSERTNNARVQAAVAEFDDRRIRYAEIEKFDDADWNPGQRGRAARARALNLGQDLARGSVIFILTEDSEFVPNHLEASIEALAEHSADLVFGPTTVHDRNTGSTSEGRRDDDRRQDLAARLLTVDPSTVGYTNSWLNTRFSESADPSPCLAKWTAMIDAGARSVALDSPQIISHGDDADNRVRVSMPSLPAPERLHDLVDAIAGSRRLSNNGPFNAQLEEALENYLGARHVITAASGDTALGMAMMFAASERDDRTEVVVPSYTFPSTVNTVVRAGLTPVFCDVEQDNLCASAATMAPLITERTLALVPVLAHGAACDMSLLEELAHESGVLLISDSAAALGATIGERKVGTYGDIEMFSLSSTKVLTAGEGGFLSLHDDAAEARLREIGRYGLDDNFSCVSMGVNGRLAEWPAGLALAGIDQLDGWLAARRRTATHYEEGLADLEHLRVVPHRIGDRVGTAKDVALVMKSPHLRADLADRLRRNRIETRPYFRPVHLMSPFKHLATSDLEVTNHLADRMLSLPITNEIPESTTEHVISVLKHELQDLVGYTV